MTPYRTAQILRSQMTKQAGPVGGAAVGGALLPVIGSMLGAGIEKDEARMYRGSPVARAGIGSLLGLGLGGYAAAKLKGRYLLLPYIGNIVGGALGAKSVKVRDRAG